MKNIDLNVDIYFAFFEGEEFGLTGSRFYISTLSDEDIESIIGNINVDCIADSHAGNLYMYSCDGKPDVISDLFEEQLSLLKNGQSDHFSFYAKEIPGIMLCQDIEGLKKIHIKMTPLII